MAGSADADADAKSNCSDSKAPGDTAQACPLRKVVTLRWDKDETWCSEGGPISGTTKKYANGEALAINITDHVRGAAITTLNGRVSGDAFSNPWDVIDVLPVGGPSWLARRDLDGEASGVKTAKPMAVRFIPNLKRDSKAHTVLYDRTDPGDTAPHKVGVSCRFELDVVNYLLTIHGALKYVRGVGRERLQLGDPSLPGGFTLSRATQHWGYKDPITGNFKYWDGAAWKDTPSSWLPDNSNHFGIPFYKSGSTWVCRDTSESWPQPLPDWPPDKFTGPGNLTDTTLATWKKNMDAVWSDKFDLKRKECKSTKTECCRYKVRCVTGFAEVPAYVAGQTLVVVYEDVRSDSGMWAFGDKRAGLAPHEFGHLLGAPDEYGGVGTTQLGVSDGDGLASGIDDDSIMGINLSVVKKRHYKGICEVLSMLVSDQFGKDYTYQALAIATSLASGTGSSPAPGSAGSGGGGAALIGAIIGGIVGAIVGAIVGFVASGGNPMGAVLGALAGATAGALAGAGIGSLI